MNDLELTFQEELNQKSINLPRAALLYARAIAYPYLDLEIYLNRLNLMAEMARSRQPVGAQLTEQTDALSEFLFDQMEFRGNRANYYDPENSYLNSVLDRKLGIPITLALIYISVAQRLGLRAYGIGLPGHFIVGISHDDETVYIDPFNAGLRLNLEDCERLVRESAHYEGEFQTKWLKPVAPVNLLARMLTNLCNAYVQHEEWDSAIQVIQHLLIVQPHSDFHLRDLGYLYMYNGSLRLCAQYLEEYLRRAPHAPDFENVRSSLQIVAGRLSLWN